MPTQLPSHHTTTATETNRRSPRRETPQDLPVRSLKHGTTPPRRQERPAARPPAGYRYVGLDVHAATIAVAGPDGHVHAYGTTPNTPIAVRTLMKRLTHPGDALAVCYEAGPMGYGLYRQLHAMHIHCDVIAPSLIPTAVGDRIKTDRRDALKLARWYRSGDLTPVWVPDAAHEALRDLVRSREDALSDRTRTRHRLTKCLLRHRLHRPPDMAAWTQRHRAWLQQVATPAYLPERALQITVHEYLHEMDRCTERVARYDAAIASAVREAAPELQAVIAALQSLRGVQFLTAVTVVSELGQLSRFPRPAQLMAYAGLVPREHSSGTRIRRSGITKCGNTHLRRIVIEAAWAYRHGPHVGPLLRKRQAGQSATVRAIAWHAQRRLCDRYHTLAQRKKPLPQVIAALARELLGFMWAIGVEVERTHDVAPGVAA
jgi:transposase